jgi:HTH-type transcriptional regulator / antitoxin MqsA
MFTCHVCGSAKSRLEQVSEVFHIEGRVVLVEQIPARVCEQCGEVTFSRETTEKVRLVLHSEAQPTRTVQMPVFAYS